MNPERPQHMRKIYRSADGKPLKRQITVEFPLLTRRERRQLIRDAKKAGKKNGI